MSNINLVLTRLAALEMITASLIAEISRETENPKIYRSEFVDRVRTQFRDLAAKSRDPEGRQFVEEAIKYLDLFETRVHSAGGTKADQ